ncbi:MAG: fatty acid desaturase [Parvibaculaceae bacterium]|jgi:beta-carotene hydroxylase|nr:fatty acid desaturase [Parvibaculaceae bacterium]
MSVAEAQSPAEVDKDQERRLYREEMAIAKKYIGPFPVVMALWCFSNLLCWLALWPLVIFDVIPLWAGFLIATANVALCYLPSHEAQHSNYANPGTPLRWLNELIGYVSTIPLVLPFKIARYTHMLHHKHTNDPKLDPDYEVIAPTWQQAMLKTVRRMQPGFPNSYGVVLSENADDPAAKRAGLEGMVQSLAYWGILCTLAWSGYALEAAFLWWVPRMLGTIYISLFLSWWPHHPMDEMGRYRNTRSFTHKLGNIVAFGMEDHIIHHLHPGMPLNRNKAAFRELRPILEARGCRLEDHHG